MKLIIDVPKRENFGEDASPIFLESTDKQISIIGVFDGMGGAGSALYTENNETHTGAYLASRVVKDVVEVFFKEQLEGESFVFSKDNIPLLEEKINEGLQKKLDKQQYEPSNIRSSLIRTFPTTIALGIISQTESIIKIQTIWAGDSRVYILSPNKGLVQLTKDDLTVENDPFQNIENDSPLSNMVCLDKNFTLNYNEHEEQEPIIIFAATDGCFGYYSTPIHFENIILKTMLDSKDFSEWEEMLINEIKKVSGDDFTLSLKSLVCNSDMGYNQFKKTYKVRFDDLCRKYMEEINKLDTKIMELREEEIKLKKNIEEHELRRKELFDRSWKSYKETNYSLFKTNTQ